MRRSNSLLGLVGLILLVFAVAAAATTGMRSRVDILYVAAHAGVGLLALIAYLSTGLENLRAFVGERSTRYGVNAIVYAAAFVAVLGLLNYISSRRHHRFDLTETSVYSLSPQSKKIVEGLQQPLEMRAFVEGGENRSLADLLGSYAYASKQVTFEMLDPDRDPVQAQNLKIREYNSLHLQYGAESTVIMQPTEESITNAIIKVSRGAKKVVCVVEGHAEPSIDDLEDPKGYGQAKAFLENENYEVKKILLATMDTVPADCSLVVAAGAARPYLDGEVQALDAHLRAGGRLLALLRPQASENLAAMLGRWGAKVGDDVVVDEVLRLFQGPALGVSPLTDAYGDHEITRSLGDRSIFPMTRSVTLDAAGKKGIHGVELVKTGPSSWAETDLDELFVRNKASLTAEDKRGPISLGVAIDANLKEMGAGDKEARLVVFGSSEFADNRGLQGTYFNRDLFLNSIGWLVGESDLVSIRPRAIRASRVQLTQDQGTVIFYASVLVLPEILLLAGLIVWWRRASA